MSDAFVVPTDTTVVAVSGADRLSYLHSVTSQDLAQLAPGEVRGALHLDPHGAPLAVFDVVALADRALLLVPDAALVEVVVDQLGGRTFLADARFARTSLRVVAVRGDDADAVAHGAELPAAQGPGTATEHGGVVVVARPAGVDVILDSDRVGAVVGRCVAAGARPGTAHELEAWRIAAGEPAWQREIVAGVLPEEVGLLPTHVHLAKGCYPGQEAVARMWMLGRPRRQLAVVAPDHTVGEGWQAGKGRRRSTVTSVSSDHDRALAFVPPDVAVGDRVEDDDGRGVEVLAIVGAGRDVPGHDPAVTRRRDR